MVPTKLYKCRLCINEGNDFTSIFDGNNRITRMIKCLPVQIRQNDDLPHHICPSCLNALDVTYSLNILCLKAHLRYLEEPEDTEQDENYHPKIQNDAPTSFLASCGEKPATTSPTINENTYDLKINNEANKWSNILQKIPEVRLSRLSDIFSVQSEIPKNSTKLINSKDETYDPDQFEPYDPCPIETKPKAPARKRGRSRKIVPQNEQSSSARTTGYLPKEKQLIPLESIPVKSQTELLVSQVSYVFAMKVMCSQCKQMFAFSALCPDELKRLTEGGVFHCIDCKTGQKQVILSPAEPQVKRLRFNGGNEDASKFTHLTEHNYALRPSTCGLRGSGEQTKEKSFQIQLLKLNKHTLT